MKLMKSEGSSAPISIFELRPDRLLLDPNFYGYKLSLDKLPAYSKCIENGVDYAKPTVDQYSLQHVKLQVFNNHIFPDLWNQHAIYFVDLNWSVLKSSVDSELRRLSEPKLVWTVPGVNSKVEGRYNITLLFPSDDLAVLSDGSGNIFLLNTGPRSNNSNEEWKTEFTGAIFESKKNSQFIILDSLLYKQMEKSYLDVLLFRIDEKSEWTDFLNLHKNIFHTTESTFISLIEWVTFEKDSNNAWSLKCNRTLLSLYAVHYASIECGGTGIYIASDGPFHFAYDSENPITIKADESNTADSKNKDRKDFVWAQTTDEVTVWFRLPDNASKHDLSVLTQQTSIKIEYQSNEMLVGNLCHPIKADETIWTLGTGKLEIIFTKLEKNLMWNTLIPGNVGGEEIMDPELVEQIHNQLAHLCSDKWGAEPHCDVHLDEEECDELPADSSMFMRLDKILQKASNQASLGSHQWLFNIRINTNRVPSFCLRHDVDGIVWQPKIVPSPDESLPKFSCEHIGTFSALGYVQASKQSRRFTVCSPDFSYAAICDTVKHIHVYRQPSPIENDLRNRKTGEKISNVSKQHVISIDPPEEIMGSYAANEFLFILTSKNLHAVQMKVTEIV